MVFCRQYYIYIIESDSRHKWRLVVDSINTFYIQINTTPIPGNSLTSLSPIGSGASAMWFSWLCNRKSLLPRDELYDNNIIFSDILETRLLTRFLGT